MFNGCSFDVVMLCSKPSDYYYIIMPRTMNGTIAHTFMIKNTLPHLYIVKPDNKPAIIIVLSDAGVSAPLFRDQKYSSEFLTIFLYHIL